MKFSEKGEYSYQQGNQLFGVNFHDFVEKETEASSIELASEFGLSLRDVQKLRKHLNRS
ncbi:RNA polymerase subunit sigma-70 [Bacillus sp. CGMCC 1.16541]|uniref:RNA polymerase subunit sigma-70 n=1 Tax=Bacillus sp. CGMCC 1.16541 TaxID=2185143 RepID=UPI000D73C2D1|nr:RNA polymerase subunit sigma-70 [Bacillus sp. CGMCC 1.16541]